ncbi:DUF4446 family protein [Paenibacillus sp. MBLB4367]|uniref:DUF4446 family protein n=1 Tax=Paenibacillus sp. MBLB4367 TaxID=3384767 RepID=UPI00390829F7
MELQGSELQAVLLALVALTGILLISQIWLWFRVGRMKKRYAAMMNGTPVGDLEDILIIVQSQLNELKLRDDEQGKKMKEIVSRLNAMKGNMGFTRYNAFAQQGSDLSFSLALLDEEQNGVVLTGIHSREESYLYAKPVEKGQSSYSLSPEEKLVIDQVALRKHS